MSTKRKELRTNDLRNVLEGESGDLRPHLNNILFGAIGILAVTLIVMYLFSFFTGGRGKEWGDFVVAQSNSAMSANSQALENFGTENHPGTEAAAWSNQLVADQNLAAAIRTYFADREEGQKAIEEVIASYSSILNDSGYADKGSMLRRAALFGRAQAYEALFEKDKAISDFEAIQAEFEGTAFAEQAAERIEMIQNIDIASFQDEFNEYKPDPATSGSQMNPEILPPIPNISFPESMSDFGDQGTSEGLVAPNTGEAGTSSDEGDTPPLQIPDTGNSQGNSDGDDTGSDDSSGTGDSGGDNKPKQTDGSTGSDNSSSDGNE